jgi:S-adenosylmethionine hydrolase
MICGEIIYIDRYGTCVTNIRSDAVTDEAHALKVGRQSVPIRKSYQAAASGSALCVPGSHGYLEIAVNGGSAQRIFRLHLGSSVMLSDNAN